MKYILFSISALMISMVFSAPASADILRLTAGPSPSDTSGTLWSSYRVTGLRDGALVKEAIEPIYDGSFLDDFDGTKAAVAAAFDPQLHAEVVVLVHGWAFDLDRDSAFETIFAGDGRAIRPLGERGDFLRPCIPSSTENCALEKVKRASWLSALDVLDREDVLVITIGWESSGRYRYAVAKAVIAGHYISQVLAAVDAVRSEKAKIRVGAHSLGTTAVLSGLAQLHARHPTRMQALHKVLLWNGAAPWAQLTSVAARPGLAGHAPNLRLFNILGHFDGPIFGGAIFHPIGNRRAFHSLLCPGVRPDTNGLGHAAISASVAANPSDLLGFGLPPGMDCADWSGALKDFFAGNDRRYALFPIGQLQQHGPECIVTLSEQMLGAAALGIVTQVRPSKCEKALGFVKLRDLGSGHEAHYIYTGRYDIAKMLKRLMFGS